MLITHEIQNFAHDLADIATEISKKYYRQENGEIEKNDESPVTLADREIEEKIRQKIIKNFPNHGIIGEEFGVENEESEWKWIIDPIDGTSSFIIGRPTFGNLIALTYQNHPILGIVNQPISGERWLGIDDAALNSGAWLNGERILARKTSSVSEAIISTTSPFFFDENDRKKFEKLCKMAKYQKYGGVIYGGDCYSYALLASGFIDIIVEPNLQIYDYAALIPIIKMAGGFVGDYENYDLELKSDLKFMACANKKLFDQAFAVMKK